MIQTNMREIDLRDIDAKEYVKQLQKFDATIAMVNAGGILANYPTQVEDHPVNPNLHGDSLEQVIDECHRAGIRVIARVDYSKMRRPVYEKHPDWAYRTSEGDIADYNGNVHACLCGGFQQKKAFEITEEIIRKFPVDGIFVNMGGFNVRDYSYHYYGICHCENCRREFRKRFGLELPDKEDFNDPIYRKYCAFKKQIMAEYRTKMEKCIHSINPNVAIEGVDFVRLESNTEYGRPQWLYDSSSTVRGQQSLQEGHPCSNPSVDFIGYYYRHVAVSPWQQSLRMWQTLANYGLLDYYIMGRLDNHEDRSGYEAVRKVFRFHRQHESLFREMQLLGDALLVRSGGYAKSAEGCGWVRALTESHILFHEAEPDQLGDLKELCRYRAIILADIPTLSEQAVNLLDCYTQQGGTLIVSGESGQYDEKGEDRKAIPFAALGTPRILCKRDDMLSAMFKLDEQDHKAFPLITDSDLFFFGPDYYYIDCPPQAERHLHLIPPHKYGPPELCFYTQVTDLPGYISCSYGKGMAIYIPWTPGALYYKEGYANTYAFLHGILTKAAHLCGVEASPFSKMVEVTFGVSKAGKRMVQLVNDSGFFGNSFEKPLEIRDIQLRLSVPEKPKSVCSLVSGKDIDFKWTDGELRLSVPVLKEYGYSSRADL